MWLRRRQDFVKLSPAAWTKFLVLAGVLFSARLATDTLFCKVCPAGSLFAAIPHRFVSPELHFGTFFYVHLITLAISLVAFFFIGRFWCRYLCPLGALLAICGRSSLLRLQRKKEKGIKGKALYCPMGAEPGGNWRAAECVLCFNCHKIQLKETLSFSFRGEGKITEGGLDLGRRRHRVY